jgi:transcription-repair coupling factor (superfamily II helicase)
VTRSRLDPEIEVPVPALLPAAWIPDVDQRVLEYRRLAACRSVEAVRDVIGAWEDEHGTPPPEVLNLGWQAEARIRARALGIEKVAWLKVRALLDLHETSTIPADRITRLMKEPLGRFSQEERAPAGCRARLAVRFTPEEAQYPFRFLHWAFRKLEEG